MRVQYNASHLNCPDAHEAGVNQNKTSYENTEINNVGTDRPSNSFECVVAYLIKFYNNTSVTRKFIQTVMENTYELFSEVLSHLKTEICDMNSLQPEQRNDRRHGNSVAVGFKTCEAQYVPIEKVLKKLLELDDVFNVIRNYINTESENTQSFTSIFNSKLWKGVYKNFKGRLVLPIFLYYDDFECGNPLGSHSGVHKVGGVYYTIGGIPPKYASRIENIFLWSLFYSSDRVQFGNDVIFREIYKQLLNLENNGIIININGDNLGVNSITGMTQSFSATNFCRICFCTKEVMQTMTLEDENYIRNKINYEQHLQEKSEGINSTCIFNSLPNFHITQNTCCDIMHDLLEGVCRYDMAKILNYFVFVKKCFSVDELNHRIKYFEYNQYIDIGNRIPAIIVTHIKKGCIIMSAAEMMSFVVHFSLLVGDLVDRESEYWMFYLTLYDIVHFSFKTEITSQELIYFKHLIKDHNQMYMQLFKEKPKHHFLVHYPSVIANVGPLTNLSSMRYEAFHKIGKTNAHVATSRINIIYTLPLRYQLKFCYRLQFKIGLEDAILVGKTLKNDLTNLTQYFEEHLNIHENIFEVDWIKFNGIYFNRSCIIKFRNNKGENKFGLYSLQKGCPNARESNIHAGMQSPGYSRSAR
ncbi:hypothetical protein NQ315_003297 [Exocentrus adspersus]|uniref:Uncharacterized protein n=1 Tax=Exocentrus adspersus TaxID=1586481 RepID=A0AAV8VAX1_9CUCU|nr:hypothetical protein NQ315_003297 [Exocentrus adspersus]